MDKTVVVRIALQGNQYAQGLRQASTDTKQFAAESSRASQQAASSAMALGTASATAGKLMVLGIGGAMAVSAKAAIDFESSLAGVAKTTDLAGGAFGGATSPLASFGQALRNLSMRTPIDANELARIAELGGQLGVQVPDLLEFTEVIAALGVTTNLSTEEAATGLARFANIMGTEQSEFDRLGSSIVALGNNLATTESEILNFATRIAPVGSVVGATEEEVFALAGALTSLGVPSERGGTAIQTLFIDIAEAVDKGSGKLEKFAEISQMGVEEFVSLWRESPARAFQEFVRGLDAITESGGSAFQALDQLDITQVRATQVLLAAASGWETVADSIDIATTSTEDGNALFEEAAKRYGTTASQVEILANTFTDLKIEIGNALLGSGGLAAAIDFGREFFGIVKENLPLLADMARVMGVVAGLRLGAWLGGAALRGVQSLRTEFGAMKGALDGVTRAQGAARLAALGLNTAMFGALAIVGLIIMEWTNAAIKAAELQSAIRALNAEIESGVDPVTALGNALKEDGILDPQAIGLLNDLGLSVNDFVQAVMQGRDPLYELGAVGENTFEQAKNLNEVLGKGTDLGAIETTRIKLERLRGVIAESSELSDAFLNDKRTEMRDTLLETGRAAAMTEEQIEATLDKAFQIFGLDVTKTEFGKWVTGEFAIDGWMGRVSEMANQGGEALNEGMRHWMDELAMREGGEDVLDGFFDGIAESITTFNDFLGEEFEKLEETIFGGFPAWDEYEQKTIESLDAVAEAQRLYVEDVIAGQGLLMDIEGEVGPRAQAWLEGLDPATLGAMARFREENAGEFQAFVDDMDGEFGRLQEVFGDVWNNELPSLADQGFEAMVQGLIASVQEMNLPGEQSAQAFVDGLQGIFAALPENHKEEFLGYLRDSVLDEGRLTSIGDSLGGPLIGGFAGALANMADILAPTIEHESNKVKGLFEQHLQVSSPSRFTMWIGEQMIAGLFVGMEDEMGRHMNDIRPMFQPAMNQMMNFAPQTVVNVPKQPVGDIALTYNNPQFHDYRQDLQRTQLILTDLVHLTEGRFN